MYKKTRSLRNIQHCHQIQNIFHKTQGQQEITTLIPPPIANNINSTQLISCQVITSLPQFQVQNEMEEELSSIVTASQFQQEWQNQMFYPHDMVAQKIDQGQQMYPQAPSIRLIGSNPARQGKTAKKLCLENQQLLKKLNELIMGEDERKYIHSTESFFDR